jgi:type I restriction enzyme, S subunit
MEVRPGYKQTDVGVIPEEWEVKRLGECASFRTGPFGTALHKSDYTDDGVPVVNPMHIVEGQIEPTRTMTITERAATNLAGFRLKADEIVIGRRGDMGRCAVVQPHQSGWLCGTGSMIVRSVNADARFLQRVLSSARAIIAIEETSVGTTMINLNQSTLSGLRMQFPPLPEQRAIADALSDADSLLGTLDQLIVKKRDLKQAAMQQLLTGQTRLPGFHSEWEVKRLGNVTEIISGGTPKTTQPSYWNGGVKWCTPTDITGCQSKYLVETERTISRLGLNSSGAQLLPAGALLLCSRATIGEIRIAGCEVCTNQGFKSLVCPPGVSNEFIFYKLLTMKQQMVERAFGSTFLEISKANVVALELSMPTLPEQNAIAEVLSDMDAELMELEQRRDKTRDLKQGMMQELLTGRTRLV